MIENYIVPTIGATLSLFVRLLDKYEFIPPSSLFFQVEFR